MIIFKSILTTFEVSLVFWGSWDSSKNCLEPNTKQPLQILACPNETKCSVVVRTRTKQHRVILQIYDQKSTVIDIIHFWDHIFSTHNMTLTLFTFLFIKSKICLILTFNSSNYLCYLLYALFTNRFRYWQHLMVFGEKKTSFCKNQNWAENVPKRTQLPSLISTPSSRYTRYGTLEATQPRSWRYK